MERGLVLHVPPDPLASIHFPGSTLFVVVTKADVVVKWRPEQDGRMKGKWQDAETEAIEAAAAGEEA